MAKLTIEGYGTFDVPEGKRLIRAIEDNGVDILHRCGVYADARPAGCNFWRGSRSAGWLQSATG